MPWFGEAEEIFGTLDCLHYDATVVGLTEIWKIGEQRERDTEERTHPRIGQNQSIKLRKY